MALVSRTTGLITGSRTDANRVNEVQTIDLGDIGAADTFTLTHGGTTTGTITYSTDMTSAIDTALEGLASIGTGGVTVAKSSLTVYTATFDGTATSGKNMGAITITGATGFTPTGVTETTKGRSAATYTMGFGSKFVEVFRVQAGLFEDASTNDLIITDKKGRTVFSATGLDLNVSGAMYNTHIGADGKDQAGNASANLARPIFEAPLTVVVRNDAAAATGSVRVYGRAGLANGKTFRSFTTGTLTTSSGGAATGYIHFADYNLAIPRQVILSGFDSSTDYVIEDDNGSTDKFTVFSKTGLDGTNATAPVGVDFAIGTDGTDQAGNAAADVLPIIAKSPLKVTIANGGNATTGSVTVICEVN